MENENQTKQDSCFALTSIDLLDIAYTEELSALFNEVASDEIILANEGSADYFQMLCDLEKDV